jgi:hypothetical protein
MIKDPCCRVFCLLYFRFGFGGVYRTNVRARTALNAPLRVNNVFIITFADNPLRAFGFTCAATDAVICNYIGHTVHLLEHIKPFTYVNIVTPKRDFSKQNIPFWEKPSFIG